MLEGWENGGFFKRDARDKGVQHAEYAALKAKLHYGLHKDRTQRRAVKNPGLRDARRRMCLSGVSSLKVPLPEDARARQGCLILEKCAIESQTSLTSKTGDMRGDFANWPCWGQTLG